MKSLNGIIGGFVIVFALLFLALFFVAWELALLMYVMVLFIIVSFVIKLFKNNNPNNHSSRPFDRFSYDAIKASEKEFK